MAVAKSKSNQTSSSKYVDFDEFINYQLKKTRSGIHHTDIITSVVVLSAVLLGYLLAFTICDHWLITGGFNDLTRTILFGLISSFSVGWLFIKIAMPLYREVNVLYAAKEIEETYPELKNSLLSWVQLREEGRDIPPDILKALEKRTAIEIKKSDVDLAVDRRFLMRSSYVLLGIVVAMCLYTVLSPKNISNSVWRALLPGSKVTASTKTVILEVIPGNYEVLAHDQLDVTVDLDGVIPEEVRLLYSTTDKRFVDEPLAMRNTGEGLPRFRTRLSGVNGEGLLKDFTYHIEAGDAVSETYFVKIKQPPSATVTEIEYDYPEYMLLDDKTQLGSTIDAWEGVYVTVRAKTNMPIVSANLFRSDNDVADETVDVIPMAKISSDEVEARWRLKFREDGTFANYYFIQVENEAGEDDPLPTIHRIKIRPDLNPEISILFPTEDMDVPANAVIPIAYEANDPDFMLRRVLLKLERQGELLPNIPRLYEGPEVPRVQAKHQLDLKPLSLKAGDQLQFYLEAEDNFEPFDQIPKHVSRTSKITLRIVEPVEKEKADEFQNEQEEQLRNQIAEDQPRNNGERPRNEPQPQEKDPKQEENGEKPDEQSAESQPIEDGEATDQAEMKNKPNSDQQNQSSDSNDSQGENDSNKKDQSTGQKTDSTESSEADNLEEEKPSEGSKSDAEQKAGEGNSSAESSQSNGSKKDSKNTKQRGGTDSKAEDDQALEELLKWSQDKPEPKEPNGDQSEQQNENPDNPTENDPQNNTNSKNESSKPNEDAGADSSVNPSESKKPESEENGSSNSPSNEDPEKNDTKTSEMPENSSSPDNKNAPPSDSSPSATNAEQKSNSMKEESITPDADQQPTENNNPNSEKPKQSDPQGKSPNEETKSPSPDKSDETQPSDNSEMSEPKQGEPKQGEPKQGEPKQGEPKQGEPKQGEPKQGEPKQGEPKQGEPKQGEPKQGEPKQGEPKQGEPKQGEPKQGEPKQGEPKQGEPKQGEPKQGEPKQGEPKQGEPKQGEPKQGEPKQGEPKQGEPKQGEPKQGEPKQGEPKQGEPKQGEPKQGEPKQGEPKQGEPKQGEPKQGEPKQGEPKQGEPKQGEPKQGEPRAKQGEPKQGEPKQGEPKQGEPKQGEPKQGEPKQGEPKQGEPKQGEPKQGEPKQGEPKQGEPKQGEPKQGEPKQGEPKPSKGSGDQGESSEGETSPGKGTSPGSKSGAGGPGGTSNKNSGKGTDSGDSVPLTPEEANLENKKKAVDLALKKLKDQIERGETPEELMEELGFSEQDLSTFMQRLEERLADPGINKKPDAESARRQFNQLLKGIDYNSTGERRDGGNQPRQSATGLGGSNRSVPPEYRIENEAYKRRLSRQGTE